MTCNWSELNQDLASLILSKLPLPDCIRFGAVCTQWNQHFNSCKQSSIKHRSMTAPWMFSVEGFEGKFYSLQENKVYHVPLPKTEYCIGAGSNGWLITSDDDVSVQLVQPFSGEKLDLPSVTTSPFFIACKDNARRHYSFKGQERIHGVIKKGVVHVRSSLSLKSLENELSVMMLSHSGDKLLFARVGDESWTVLKVREVIDLIIHNGQLYTLDVSGSVEVWEQDGSSFKPKPFASLLDESKSYAEFEKDNPVFFDGNFNLNKIRRTDRILVGSADGDQLMMVWLISTGVLNDYVYKVLVWDKQKLKWKHMKSLDDQVLFLGRINSVCLSVSELPEMNNNWIYTNRIIGRRDNSFEKIGFRRYSIEFNRLLYDVWFTPRIC